MAADLLTSARLARDPDFLDRITMAMYVAAKNVENEELVAGYESYRNKRLTLALSILQSPGAMASVFALATAANPVITTDSTDNDIQYTVNSLWNGMSGVTLAEVPPGA